MTYFTALGTNTGVNKLDTNPCNLLDFQLVSLADGETISGQTNDREVLAVILGGKANFAVGESDFGTLGSRPNVFSGKPTSVYMPHSYAYSITAVGKVEIALCSAPSDLDTSPYVINPDKVTEGRWGAANFSRNFHQILTQDGQPDLPARRLIVGETFTPSGHWSTYPAHKHEKDEGSEVFHEEMYFFKVSPNNGFGLARHYGDGYEDNHTVRDNTILMIPHGYHTYVGAPGFTSYYLWFLAGEHRTQGVSADPDTGWVNQTVPMLRNLGH
ncbi:MAG: 5-deoxy-glucuronate isomerase [Phototrophicaceae bacterium]